MSVEFENVYLRAAEWAQARGYAGYDPFDALNSRIFQLTPLRHSRPARLIWTQLFKRSPVDFRRIALVPAGKNSKGLALFALAALSWFRVTRSEADETRARVILDELLATRLKETGETAWGYNFDWQARAFFAPKGTPAVVPTAFAVRALVDAHKTFEGAGEFLSHAREACNFIVNSLNRSHEAEDEICFSYTPADRTRVFNASLLAAESLAAVGAITQQHELLTIATRAVRYVLRRQRIDGSWVYGEEDYQSWADSFHTAFILTSLARIRKSFATVGELIDSEINEEIRRATRRAFDDWSQNYFLSDGWPQYFRDQKYPADAHSAGAAIVACAELVCEIPAAMELAHRVAVWTVRELFDPGGFFRYQRRRFYTVRAAYMRWSQAWMMYALARLAEVSTEQMSDAGC